MPKSPFPARRGQVRRKIAAAGLLLWAFAAAAMARPDAGQTHWVGSWAAAQQVPETWNALAPGDLDDATLRQVVHLSLGGSALRVRISNSFGTAPLHVSGAHVALAQGPGASAIRPGSDRAVAFAGAAEVVVPAGADYWSDPVALPVAAQDDLAVSLHLETAPTQQTSHPGARATSYLVHGDHLADPDLNGARRLEHWFQLSGVEVVAAPRAFAIVTFGDSITDGHGATTDHDDRWPDDLARRLHAAPATRDVGVLNLGIGGNRLLNDGLGPNALARLDRDVLAQDGARWVILLEGINDLGTLTMAGPVDAPTHARLVASLIGAYGQMIDRAHAHGLKVIGATLTPFVGFNYYHPDAANEADRQALNAWIRGSGRFDAVVDFDQALRDPARPERLRAEYDSGDHIHPSPAGYQAMAEAIPLGVLGR